MSGAPVKPFTYPGVPALQHGGSLEPTVAALVEIVELLTGARANGQLAAARNVEVTRQLAEINRRLTALGG